MHFSWFKNGQEIKDFPSIKIRTNEELSTLLIDSISSGHSANYTCKISNRYGQDSHNSELLVEGKNFVLIYNLVLFFCSN